MTHFKSVDSLEPSVTRGVLPGARPYLFIFLNFKFIYYLKRMSHERMSALFFLFYLFY